MSQEACETGPDATGLGNVIIRCLNFVQHDSRVVGEPGKCETCLSPQEVALQSTHLPST